MIKKVNVDQLKPGMFIHDLDTGWSENPMFNSGFKIKTEGIIAKISEYGVRDVYIDTDKGDDLPHAPTRQEVRREIDKEIGKVAAKPEAQDVPRMPIREEMQKAKRVQKDAKKLVHNIMDDVRLGKQIETEKVDGMVEQMIDSVFRNQDALISLGKIKQADEYTFQHSVSVCVLMTSFCKALDIDRETITKVAVGGMLHDIGKMNVPPGILNKPGKLTDDEFVTMKAHASSSRDILKQTPGISPDAVEVAGQHHERYDGSGYPDRLKGDEIGRFGQMAAIVDVYDAITSDRVYHKGMDSGEALKKIYEWSDYHFNKELVQKYIRCVGIYPMGTLVQLESGFLGVVTERGAGDMLHPVMTLVYNVKKDRHITPHSVDLSKLKGTDKEDRIVGPVPAEKYNINPYDFLDIF